MRILIDLPDRTVEKLKGIALPIGEPRAEVIRRAVDAYVSEHAEPISAFFGLWADNPQTKDVAGLIDGVRGEWVR